MKKKESTPHPLKKGHKPNGDFDFGNTYGGGPQPGSGAPKIYTKEWCDQEAELFLEWLTHDEGIFFKTFCWERRYDPQRLSEFAKTSTRFAEVMRLAHLWQEQKLVCMGLKNQTNSTITKCLLGKYGYSDNNREEARVSDEADVIAQAIRNAMGKSKSLVNESNSDC